MIKNHKKTASISTKINIAGLLVFGLFILCFITFYFLQNKLMSNDYFFNNYSKYSALIASESDFFLITNDKSDLKVVNRIRENFPAIVGYHIFSDNSSVFNTVDGDFKWPIHQPSMFNNYQKATDGIIYENSNYLIYKYNVKIEKETEQSLFEEESEDINIEKETIGTSFVLVNRNTETINSNQYILIISLFLIFFMGTWFFYTHFLKIQIIKPLQNLSKSLDTASKGIYIPARSDFSSNEMLMISENFNQLLEQTKSKEKALNDAIDLAKNKADEKTEFSATLSHEIRTPLNGVIGSLELIDTSKMDRNNKEIINIIKYSADHLLGITNSSLDFSKYSLDNVEFHTSTTNLYKLLLSCLNMHKSSADKNGLFVNVNYPSNIPLHFEIDDTKVQQMVSNIVGNAVKFTDHGYITIDVKCFSTSLNSCEIEISIQDSGSGISSDKLVSIFEPYKQENGTAQRKIGGTGLGLSISKRLAVLMGGDITVSSELDSGSCFTISLEMKTSETSNKSQSFLKKMPSKLKTNFKFASIINDDFLSLNTKTLFEHYDIHHFNDIESFKRDFDYNEVVLLTDIRNSDIELVLKNFKSFKIIQIQKEYFEEDFFNISFPMDKMSLDYNLLQFLDDNLIIEDDENKFNLKSIAQRESLHVDGELSILVAEDNKVNQMVIKKLLLQCDQSNITLAENGLEVLQKISENHYDLILMDCQMPLKDGYEATSDIRALENELGLPPIPIVALTANVDSVDIALCKNIGMTYFVSKPIRLDKLKKTLSFVKSKNMDYFVID